MIFLNKLIKNLFLISTLILNIKAAIFNITFPDNEQKNNIVFSNDSLNNYNIFKLIKEKCHTYLYDSETHYVKVDGKSLKEPIKIETSKTYNIEVLEKHKYYIKFTNPLDSNYNNKEYRLKSYDLTFSEFLYEFWKDMSGFDRSIESIEYFKMCEGKLYEIKDEATDNKEEIKDLENFIFDHNKKYLLYFPININDQCEIRIIHGEDDYDYLKYSPNYCIPKNKTIKDVVDFVLNMYNLNKDNVKYYKKSKKDKKVNIYLKKNIRKKYKHLSPEEEEHLKRTESNIEDDGCDCLGDCIKCCAGCCVRCKAGLKKVKYEDL